ncbi:MAG: hypothetical protein LV480_01505 [Methylacidiphilales bacterium]|nr:hypothetical protein [Candidatus Methylacidiphilales bacterium]
MKPIAEIEKRRGGQIRSDSPVAKVAIRYGIGYREMAEQTGISHSVLKRLSSRKYKMTHALARCIASRYEVSTEYLLELDPGDIDQNGAWKLSGLGWQEWRIGGEPFGVAEEVGLSAKERNAALVAALNDCAGIISYELPQSDTEKVFLANMFTWFARRKYSEEEVSKMKPAVKQALKLIADMDKQWNYAPPVVKQKQMGNLARHFSHAFFTHVPARKLKAHTTLMRSLDELARDAREHPQAPLIRKEIIKAHVEIRLKHGIK